MNILMLAINDPAGTAVAFAKAVSAHTPHRVRLATLETRYTHRWEKDLHLPDLDEGGLAELEELFASSDVFHFHMTADEHIRFGPFLPKDFMDGKKIVHHHHGHPDFRGNPGKYRRKYEELGRRNLLVSTPDLMRLLPEARWQPNLVPVHEEPYTPLDGAKPDDPFMLAHSPTRKDLKNTDDLLAVVEDLRARGTDIDLDLIDDVPHLECLERKRRCHALFDHMQGYYGVSSLEGLSQGLAVIAGLDGWATARVAEFAGTDDLPWIRARNREELACAVSDLAGDPDMRAEAGREARAFMTERWPDAKVARRLANVYDNLT